MPEDCAGTGQQPLIVIPGFQGSMLVDRKTERRVWGAFVGAYAHPERPRGMRAIALPMQRDLPLSHLHDDVEPDRLLDRFQFKLLRLLPWYVSGYGPLLHTLKSMGYRFAPPDAPRDASPSYNAFVFLYDWRRDASESARQLYQFIQKKRNYILQHSARCGLAADDTLRFDLVAHSMGALVVRYFLRYGDQPLPGEGPPPPVNWKGARDVQNVVLVAPPNAGSLRALEVLVQGRKYLPGTGRYESAVVGTMPALYQLLPHAQGGQIVYANDTTRSVGDLFDPGTWERLGWGLADTTQAPVLQALLPEVSSPDERRRIALGHLAKSLGRARRFIDAIEAPAPDPPPHLSLHILAGDHRPTDATAAWDVQKHQLHVIERQIGDSQVLRSSALHLSDLRDHTGSEQKTPSVAYVKGRHLEMMRRPSFAALLQWSLEDDPKRFAGSKFINHGNNELWISMGRVHLLEHDDLLLPADVDVQGAFEAALLHPLNRKMYLGLGLSYAYVPAPPRVELAQHLGAVAFEPRLKGGAIHYLRTTFTLDYRLSSWRGIIPFVRLSPGTTWAFQKELVTKEQIGMEERERRLRRKRLETAFVLPVGLGLVLPLRSRLRFVVMAQKDLQPWREIPRGGLLDIPIHLGLCFDLDR